MEPGLCAVLAASLAAPAACRGSDDRGAPPERAAAGPARAVGIAGPKGAPDAGAGESTAKLVDRLVSSPVVGARPISPRSLSVKLALASGDRAVWKPLRRTNRTARYEVAFYKVAPLVGAGGVPASALRRVPLAQLAGLLEVSYPDAAKALRDEALADGAGLAGGAIIEWIDELGPPRFAGETGWKALAALLAADGPSPTDEPGVAAASRMVVADYVAGNWDRFSGGNLFADTSGRGLWLVDNNGSFARWSDKQRARMDGQLAACGRFSASQIERLRELTVRSVRAALVDEEARGVVEHLLTDDEVHLVLERRDTVLRKVDAEIAARGAAAVIAFP
jgi:hypothetical protein